LIAYGKKAEKNYMPMQAGDVPAIFADIDSLKEEVGFKPDTDIKYGMQQFVAWFKAYYKLA
jgi:UDP-glucuronate 4-epimerase